MPNKYTLATTAAITEALEAIQTIMTDKGTTLAEKVEILAALESACHLEGTQWLNRCGAYIATEHSGYGYCPLPRGHAGGHKFETGD